MSRIREALTKIEGGPRPVAPVPQVAPVASQYATARELGPRRYERAAYVEPRVVPPAPAYEAPEDETPAYETPVAPYAPTASPGEALPGIPGEFHRELAALRFTLENALPGRTTRVVQFAAAVGGEGTTTVAANFARVLAQDATQNVLLVDANVRRPGLALFFGLAEHPGLRELLEAGAIAETERYLQAVERPNLHVLTATGATSDLAQVFAPEALREFWSQIGRHYQWVIVDAAPVIEAPETSTVGGTVDTTVIVIQAARTKRGVVQRALERCAKAGAPVLGAVLNRRRLDIPEFIYRRI
jgi:Mrp family chromosome partitioning ATPase